MRFSISYEAALVRVTLTLKHPSVRAIRKGLSEIERGLPGGARVLLEVTETGHLNASEMGALLEWAWEAGQRAEELVVCTQNRSLRALLELVSAHRLVTIFDDPDEAARFLRRREQAVPAANALAGTASFAR